MMDTSSSIPMSEREILKPTDILRGDILHYLQCMDKRIPALRVEDGFVYVGFVGSRPSYEAWLPEKTTAGWDLALTKILGRIQDDLQSIWNPPTRSFSSEH